MATVVKSMATSGVDSFLVEIEVSVLRGQQPMLSIIGLPDQAVKESGERIQAAIDSCGYDIPKDKVIISLAPGNRKKRGFIRGAAGACGAGEGDPAGSVS